MFSHLSIIFGLNVDVIVFCVVFSFVFATCEKEFDKYYILFDYERINNQTKLVNQTLKTYGEQMFKIRWHRFSHVPFCKR
jgi:hypothetical protein